MPTVLQLRRGTTAQHSSFTGAVGELTVDTTKDTVVVHDGSTAGGFPLAKESVVSTKIGLSDLSATDSGGDGSFSYDNSTGVFTYTGPSAAEVRAHFSSGTGITITNGQVAVDTSTIATKTYADNAATTAVANVIDSAPATLDTLNELAAALGDDANFSTTVTTALGNRLRVDVNNQSLTSTQQGNALTNLGLTASLTELNYVDGVTSAIQTQLDAKFATSNFNSTFDTRLGTKSTTNLSEGTNLYYTDARARGAISVTDNGGEGSLSYNSTTGAITYTGPSASDILTALKTVDGSGSGLDADLLDGNSSAHYRINVYDAAGNLLN